MGRVLSQCLVELPQLAVGLVEEDELLLRVEDGDGGGDAIERPVVGNGRLAVQLALGLFDRCDVDVDGRGGGRVLEWNNRHVMRLALAADDQRDAYAIALAAGENARCGAALALLEQLDLALLHLGAAARLDGADVGIIDPGEAAVLAAQPDRDGQGIEQRAAGADLAAEALVLGKDAGDLVAMPGNVAEAQHGPAPRGTALGLDVAAGHRAHDDVERVASGEQGVERWLQD